MNILYVIVDGVSEDKKIRTYTVSIFFSWTENDLQKCREWKTDMNLPVSTT